MNVIIAVIFLLKFSMPFWLIAGLETVIFLSILIWFTKKIKYKKTNQPDFGREYRLSEISSSVFLVGDMGALPAEREAPIVKVLKKQLPECNRHSALVFLGDNIYPHGMPEKNNSERVRAEQRISSQIKIADGYTGKVIFISGNHDWNKGKKSGWEYAKRQEEFVDARLNDKNAFLPHNGCPGPDCLDLNNNLSIIVINTQWWVQKGFVPIGKKCGCQAESEEDFFKLLKNCLDAHKHKRILVIGHHPLYSNSAHGGKFSTRQHLFPLTSIDKRLMVPVPFVGSLYPIYRKYIGAKEDMSYPEYRRMRKRLLEIFTQYPGLIYASGHDHNLQYIKEKDQHYIISGSGSKSAYVRQGGKAIFTASEKGFIRLNFLKNGEVWLEAWRADDMVQQMLFTTQID
jgi:predicted phosphodiesterase